MDEIVYTPGRIVWRDLMTRDAAKAKAFYGEMFGWTWSHENMGPYSMIQAGGKPIGGILSPPAGGPPPRWVSYVSVSDVDATVKTAAASGGRVVHGPEDVNQAGRFAVILDPAGAVIQPWKSVRGDGPARGTAWPGVGEFCWETLATDDLDRARDFYGKVFGWKPMAGPEGTGLVFTTAEGAQVADVQKAVSRPPSWTTYVVVEKIETARDRASKLGATIPVPLVEVPKVGRVALMADPEGAILGLFEPLS